MEERYYLNSKLSLTNRLSVFNYILGLVLTRLKQFLVAGIAIFQYLGSQKLVDPYRSFRRSSRPPAARPSKNVFFVTKTFISETAQPDRIPKKKIKILDKNLIESLRYLNVNSEEIHNLKINCRITEDKQTYKFYGLIHICQS